MNSSVNKNIYVNRKIKTFINLRKFSWIILGRLPYLKKSLSDYEFIWIYRWISMNRLMNLYELTEGFEWIDWWNQINW